jgi:hypothetical protein
MRVPTCEELDLISGWSDDVWGLVEFISAFWWRPEETILLKEDDFKLYLELNTMGWKGNEELVQAIMDNNILKCYNLSDYTYKFEFNKH